MKKSERKDQKPTQQKYAEVLANNAFSQIKGMLTYKIPASFEEKIKIGQLLRIPFKTKMTTGIIFKIHKKKPAYATKNIADIISTKPVLSIWQQKLFYWIMEYYFCDSYRIIKLFLPKKILAGKFPSINETPSAYTRNINGELHANTQCEANKAEVLPKFHEANLSYNKHASQRVLKFPIKTVDDFSSKFKKPIIIYHHDLQNTRFKHYRNLAIDQYQQGKQTLILTAETHLTPTFIQYFENAFEDELITWHSSLTEKKKAETWQKIWDNDAAVVIGSRSALFLPFHNLGLIIIDQEHDHVSYKQDQFPRYDARTIALTIRTLVNGKLILASHAPRIESYFLAQSGKANVLREKALKKKNIITIDMRNEIKKGNFSMISEELEIKIEKTLKEKKQVLLFLNKKGTSSAIICRECGEKMTCTQCQSTPTYFRTKNVLICHHCGFQEKVASRCKKCHSTYLKQLGGGTERLEEELKKRFPSNTIVRIDANTCKKQKDFSSFLEKTKKTDIIIGTQLLLKSEKYEKVGLIGIILADLSFQQSDYRSHEKAFQIFTNFINLKTAGSEIVIQSYQPQNPIIQYAISNNYSELYKKEKEERKAFFYPPFSTIIRLTYAAPEEHALRTEINFVKNTLQKKASSMKGQIFDTPAMPYKIKNSYQHHIIVKGMHPHKIIQHILPLKKGWKIDRDPRT